MLAVFGGSRKLSSLYSELSIADLSDRAFLHAFDALDEERIGAGLEVAQEDLLPGGRLPGGVTGSADSRGHRSPAAWRCTRAGRPRRLLRRAPGSSRAASP